MHTRNQNEFNGCKPNMIIQKIKDVIRGKNILQNSKPYLNRTDLKYSITESQLYSHRKWIFSRILLTIISKAISKHIRNKKLSGRKRCSSGYSIIRR